jgi:molybdopterin biosynthesis enzyme MoaB
MVVGEHRSEAGEPILGFALLTVSDTRDERTDKGGELLRRSWPPGMRRSRGLVRDDIDEIRAAVEPLASLQWMPSW